MHQAFMFAGATIPTAVTNIESIITSFSTANISWSVSEISYTPETYTVVYGTDRLNLNARSINISDVSQTGKYSIELTQLEHSTVYFYLVESSNTVGHVNSEVHSFEVDNACKMLKTVSIGLQNIT